MTAGKGDSTTSVELLAQKEQTFIIRVDQKEVDCWAIHYQISRVKFGHRRDNLIDPQTGEKITSAQFLEKY